MKELDDNTLMNFLTGQCSERELDEVSSYVKESDENARHIFRMEEIYHLGRKDTLITDKQINRAEKRLFSHLNREKPQPRKQLVITPWRKYAAVIALLILSGAGLGYWFSSVNAHKEMIVEVADTDAVKTITLPDGTTVWLNKGSILKYPDQLAGKERNVYIEGEAYFEVAKNPERPFIVQSDAIQVKVLGTTFNFKSEKNCRIAETTLIEGEVEVKGNNNEGMIILSPGQRAELNKSTGRLVVKQVNARLDAVWRNDLIPFEQANLFNITKTLERFYNVKIILAPNIRTDVTYSGVVKRKNTIESVLNSLKKSIPIDYKIVDNNVFISSRDK